MSVVFLRCVRSLVLSSLIALQAIGCRSGRGKAQEAIGAPLTATPEPGDGSAPVSADTDSSNESNVLWSPEQRVAQATFHYLVGEMLLQRGNVRDGSVMISSAYALDSSPFLGSRAIIAKAESGAMEEATREAERLVLLYPRNMEAKVLLAQLQIRNGKFKAASTQLEAVIAGKPQDEASYLMLIELNARTGNRKKAREIADRLVKVRPNSATGWSILARLRLLDGVKKETLSAAKRAWSIQASPDNAILYALALELNGNPKEALRIYESAYKSLDSSEKLTAKLVELYRQVGNLEEALRVLSDIKKGAGAESSVELEIQRVAILWELKRDTEAVAILEQLSKGDQRPDLVATLLGFGYERVKRPEDALQAYRKVTREFVLFKDVAVRICLLLKELGRSDEAYQAALGYLSAPEPAWEFYVVAAELASDSGKNDEAHSHCVTGYRRFPDQHRLLFLAGVYLEKAGKYKDAMATMREVILIQPENSTALNFLGYLMVEHGGDLREARGFIERALAIRPDDGAYLDSLGWCLFKMGDIAKAEELLLRAVKNSPDEGVIMEHLAEVAIKRNNLDAAIGWLEKAMAQKLEPQDRARIEARLKEVRRKQ